jgi:large subunit ribosomal protein L23
MNLYTSRQYTFFVDRRLTKTQLKYVFEKIFAVTIVGINTWNPPVKSRRVGRSVGNRSRYKKVSIKLKEGETLTDLVN